MEGRLEDRAPAVDPLIGKIISERYRVLERIGRGGFGAVYKVQHIRLDKTLALKVLFEHSHQNPRMIKRFEREARATCRIGHDNIVEITDFARDRRVGYYFVMEYLEGETLCDRLRTLGPMPTPSLIHVGCQIADALAATHGKGIVHRDLKPDNIFLVRKRSEDFVKVLDFGIAAMGDLEEDVPRLTRQNMMLGTPAYMSPEQAEGRPPDHRADIYSLGIILYEMATGAVPFRNGASLAVLEMHRSTPPTPPRTARPDLDIPQAVERIILRALRKPVAQRYQTMREVYNDLVALGREMDMSGVDGRRPDVLVDRPPPLPRDDVDTEEPEWLDEDLVLMDDTSREQPALAAQLIEVDDEPTFVVEEPLPSMEDALPPRRSVEDLAGTAILNTGAVADPTGPMTIPTLPPAPEAEPGLSGGGDGPIPAPRPTPRTPPPAALRAPTPPPIAPSASPWSLPVSVSVAPPSAPAFDHGPISLDEEPTRTEEPRVPVPQPPEVKRTSMELPSIPTGTERIPRKKVESPAWHRPPVLIGAGFLTTLVLYALAMAIFGAAKPDKAVAAPEPAPAPVEQAAQERKAPSAPAGAGPVDAPAEVPAEVRPRIDPRAEATEVAMERAPIEIAAMLEPEPVAVADPREAEAEEPGRPRAALEAEAARSSMRVAVQSDPSGAKVALDGQEVGTTPYVLDLPRDGKKVKIAVALDGYVTETREVEAKDDTTLVVKLKKKAVKAPPVAPKGPGRDRPGNSYELL